MNNVYIYAYHPASESAGLLRDRMDIWGIKHENSRFRGSPRKTVINWGSGQVPRAVADCRIINRPDRVAVAANKLSAFRAMDQGDNRPRVPEWTIAPGVAHTWALEGHRIVVRGVLNGHEGRGIQIIDGRVQPNLGLPEAPLYTIYIPKKKEYRVHWVGERTLVQVKLKRRGFEGRDTQIRNTANGYIFGVREDYPQDVTHQAGRAMAKLGLDFGAVDVVFNEHQGRAYVLEVNTAPGIEGRTVDFYSNALELLINGRN